VSANIKNGVLSLSSAGKLINGEAIVNKKNKK